MSKEFITNTTYNIMPRSHRGSHLHVKHLVRATQGHFRESWSETWLAHCSYGVYVTMRGLCGCYGVYVARSGRLPRIPRNSQVHYLDPTSATSHSISRNSPGGGGGGTQIWFRRGCAAEAAKPVPIFKGHFGGKGYTHY